MPRLNSNDNLFTSKLGEILSDQQTQTTISWGQNMYTIEINDKAKLLQNILPKYFRHNRFQSFVRQMNLYGFKKIRSSKKHCFINLELKNGKKLTELKSKNQIKRELNQNQLSDNQSVNESFSHQSEIVQKKNLQKDGFLKRQDPQSINALENFQKNYQQVAYQRPLAFYYNQMVTPPLMQLHPYNYFSSYHNSYYTYQ